LKKTFFFFDDVFFLSTTILATNGDTRVVRLQNDT